MANYVTAWQIFISITLDGNVTPHFGSSLAELIINIRPHFDIIANVQITKTEKQYATNFAIVFGQYSLKLTKMLACSNERRSDAVSNNPYRINYVNVMRKRSCRVSTLS